MKEQAIQFLKTFGEALAFVNILAVIGAGYVLLLIHALDATSLDDAKQAGKAILLLNAAVIILFLLFSIYYYITGGQDFR